jgi:hypothetical protein
MWEATSTTDSYVYPRSVALKLNNTWVKCKVARFLLLRQKIWGREGRTINGEKFIKRLGHRNETRTRTVLLTSAHMVSLLETIFPHAIYSITESQEMHIEVFCDDENCM